MRIHEQIYTSAAELLEGGGNLGVVAKTKGFPLELAPDLASLRSYTMLPSLPIDQPDKHPARYVGGPKLGGTLYSFSRIAFGGFDHTGRTTPLAHHLAMALSDIEREAIAPAEMLASAEPMFVRRYSPPPRWIDPPREIDARNDDNSTVRLNELISKVAPSLIGLIPRIASTVFAFGTTRRPAVIVVDPAGNEDPLGLLKAVLSVLPASLQRSIAWATHVVEATDYVRDAAIVFTYAGTPFLEQCQFRRDGRAPIVFGTATAPFESTVPADNAWATIIGNDWPNDLGRAIDASRKWDELRMKPVDVEKFSRVASLIAEMESALPERVDDLGKTLAVNVSQRALAEWVSNIAEKVVERWAGNADALVSITCDQRWPQIARAAAINVIFESAKVSSAIILQLSRKTRPPGDLTKLVEAGIAGHADLVSVVFNRAALTNANDDIDAVEFLLTSGSIDMFVAIELAEHVPTFSPDRQRLVSGLLKAISKVADSRDRLEMLFNTGSTERDRQFIRSVTLPILRSRIESVIDSVQWQIGYSDFVRMSAFAQDVSAQAKWCFQRFGSSLAFENVNQWLLNDRIDTAGKEAVRREAASAGIQLDKPVVELAIVGDSTQRNIAGSVEPITSHQDRTYSTKKLAETGSYYNSEADGSVRAVFVNRALRHHQAGDTSGLLSWINILLAAAAIAGATLGCIPLMVQVQREPPFLKFHFTNSKDLIVPLTICAVLLLWILSNPLVGLTIMITRQSWLAKWMPYAVPFVLCGAALFAWWWVLIRIFRIM